MISKKTARTWKEINLDAIRHNIKQVRKRLNEHTMIMGVVKANAYGHGAVEVSEAMLDEGVSMLAVAEINEAEQLRNANIDAPILILGPEAQLNIPKVIELSITTPVTNPQYAYALSRAAEKAGKTAKVHIKLDTGMTRVGFNPTEESLDEIVKISKLPAIVIEGIYTHFACADMQNRHITDLQFNLFSDFVKKLSERGVEIPIKHVANSAAIMRFPEYQLDMVRSGIISYGYSPLEKEVPCDMELIPAMTVKSKITRINIVHKGTPVSYGHTFSVNTDKAKIATIPIGYADGYIRAFSNKAHMSVSGMSAPVVGRICMDQCMIDVTSVNNINIGDEVIIFGDGKNSSVTADTLAQLCGTISYEILCLLGDRIPYVYISNGETW